MGFQEMFEYSLKPKAFSEATLRKQLQQFFNSSHSSNVINRYKPEQSYYESYIKMKKH